MANKKEINKRVQYAKEILEKDPTLNYHDITRMMCLEFDLEYTDAKRTTFSRILTKRGIESGWSGHKAKDKMDTSPEFQKAKKKNMINVERLLSLLGLKMLHQFTKDCLKILKSILNHSMQDYM